MRYIDNSKHTYIHTYVNCCHRIVEPRDLATSFRRENVRYFFFFFSEDRCGNFAFSCYWLYRNLSHTQNPVPPATKALGVPGSKDSRIDIRTMSNLGSLGLLHTWNPWVLKVLSRMLMPWCQKEPRTSTAVTWLHRCDKLAWHVAREYTIQLYLHSSVLNFNIIIITQEGADAVAPNSCSDYNSRNMTCLRLKFRLV